MNTEDTWHAAGTRGGRLVTLHSVELTWSQWTSVLTHNIITRGLQVATTSQHGSIIASPCARRCTLSTRPRTEWRI